MKNAVATLFLLLVTSSMPALYKILSDNNIHPAPMKPIPLVR